MTEKIKALERPLVKSIKKLVKYRLNTENAEFSVFTDYISERTFLGKFISALAARTSRAVPHQDFYNRRIAIYRIFFIATFHCQNPPSLT
jgi:hypothetical protein